MYYGSKTKTTTHLEIDLLGRVTPVLFDDARRLLQVPFLRLLRPPVHQVAGLVELPALVVEPVRDLVADHEPDGAVVHVPRTVAGEERALQDAGRKFCKTTTFIIVRRIAVIVFAENGTKNVTFNE